MYVSVSEGGGSNEVVRHALAHADALYNFARWLVRTPSDAEDLVQETYARALGAAHQFEPGSNLKAWLFRILRNTYLDGQRRSSSESVALEADAALEPDAPVGDSMDEARFEQVRALVAEDVAEAVHALPEAWRTVILLDLEGMTETEVARVLGCAEGTVKSRLSRARAALRERLVAYRP
ncbi:sigma-70 family RNA polymerase sigma factor [Archangium violaceum]|uniref:sigma-70 family RNA polymerase sigma factor n=1 Tax=Archangium violaceum TaxID=83451 RepID=UPI002B2F7792|nr:sigma-70 family RNA polymerase sigma factor [Archangium gephyra]